MDNSIVFFKTLTANSLYLANIRRCFPDLQRLYFTGGEPTLIRSNLQILRELVSMQKTDLLASFTTNLSHWDENIYELGKQFTQFEITGSIDAYGDVNDYIRYPSRWQTIMDNVDRILSLGQNVFFSIISVIQITNIKSFLDLLENFANDARYKRIEFWPTILQSPRWLHIENLSNALKAELLNRIDEVAKADLTRNNLHHLLNIRNQLSLHSEKDETKYLQARKDLLTHLRYLDSSRKTDFHKIWPELWQELTCQ